MEHTFTRHYVNAKAKKEADYLEKLQRNRKKAAKDKKAYWQTRIDDFFLHGVIK